MNNASGCVRACGSVCTVNPEPTQQKAGPSTSLQHRGSRQNNGLAALLPAYWYKIQQRCFLVKQGTER